jgi:hypothetical protein
MAEQSVGSVGSVDAVAVEGSGPGALAQPATVDLRGVESVEEIAYREGWLTPDGYTFQLTEEIRHTRAPFDVHRERLAALAAIAEGIDNQTTARELARHYELCTAMFERFARCAAAASGPKANSVAESYTNAALKAQRAAMACLSALKVLGDAGRAGGKPLVPLATTSATVGVLSPPTTSRSSTARAASALPLSGYENGKANLSCDASGA